jgi:hypothetical protein
MKLLTTTEAMEYAADRGLSAASTWAHWAQDGEPPYRKDASRFRLYAVSDLEDWIRSRVGSKSNGAKKGYRHE